MWGPKSTINRFPAHYLLVAGRVIIEKRNPQPKSDPSDQKCGKDDPDNPPEEIWDRDFQARRYDIDLGPNDQVKLKQYPPFPKVKDPWLSGARDDTTYADKGPVQPIFGPPELQRIAEMDASKMGKYDYKYNNCVMFTDKFYKDLQGPPM